MKGSFVIPGGVGFCNAVRRTLLSDTRSEAPVSVEFRENTSYQTDEFIAHRIGLIPFRRTGNGDSITLSVKDRTAVTSDFSGIAFQPCEGNIEIMCMLPGQSLDLTVRFDEKAAHNHARYNICAALGMEKVDGEGRHRIAFETINDSPPVAAVLQALDALEVHADDALMQLSRTDLPPPKTMC